jgi:hypothetical protein
MEHEANAPHDREADEFTRRIPECLRGNTVSLSTVALVIHPDRPVHVATARKLLDRLAVPFVRVGGERIYRPAAILQALGAEALLASAPPRAEPQSPRTEPQPPPARHQEEQDRPDYFPPVPARARGQPP